MTVGGPVVAVTVALAIIAGIALVGRRLRRARRVQAEAAVRPILFDIIDRSAVDLAVVAALRPAHQRALEALARSLLPKLRGQDRDTLAHLLDARGLVGAARRGTRSRRASVRVRAGRFLAEAGSDDAVIDLSALLHDSNPQVRWSAARSLGRLGNPAALSPLLGSLEGAHPLPVDVVADAIFAIRCCPVSMLRQGTRSRSVPMRAATVELLGRFQALVATEDVVKILQSDPSTEVRARAARSLGRMGSPRSIEALIGCVGTTPAPVEAQALWALGEIGAPDALPVLRATLLSQSRQMSEVAAEALVALGPPGLSLLAHVAGGEGFAAENAAAALAGKASVSVAG